MSANTLTATVDIPSDPREDSNEILALAWTEAQLNPALEVLHQFRTLKVGKGSQDARGNESSP